MKLSFAKPAENQGGNWEPLPAGTYDLQIDNVEGGRVTKNDNPQVMIKAHVVGGTYDGKVATLFYVLSPKATWRFAKLLDATGTEYTEPSEGELDVETDDLLGAYFECDISERVYNGKKQNDYSNERPSKLSQTAAAPAQAAPAIAQPQTAPAAAKAAPAPAPAATAQALPQRRARA